MRKKISREQMPQTDSQRLTSEDPAIAFERECGDLTLDEMRSHSILDTAQKIVDEKEKGDKMAKQRAEAVMREAIESVEKKEKGM